MTTETKTHWALSLWLVLGLSTFGYAQGGSFGAPIENFWRLISTGGRTFTRLTVSSASSPIGDFVRVTPTFLASSAANNGLALTARINVTTPETVNGALSGLLSSSAIGATNNASSTSALGLVGVGGTTSTEAGALGTYANESTFRASIVNLATGFTVTNAYGFYLPTLVNLGTITNAAGIAIRAIGVATNNTALLLGTVAIPSGNYGIYNTSTNPNYFAGNLGVGESNPITAKVVVSGDIDATTAFGAIGTASRLRTSCATPASLGNGDWWVDTAAGNCTTAATTISIKAQNNGVTRTIASVTF